MPGTAILNELAVSIPSTSTPAEQSPPLLQAQKEPIQSMFDEFEDSITDDSSIEIPVSVNFHAIPSPLVEPNSDKDSTRQSEQFSSSVQAIGQTLSPSILKAPPPQPLQEEARAFEIPESRSEVVESLSHSNAAVISELKEAQQMVKDAPSAGPSKEARLAK
jgi:hypothetical protein